MASKASLRVSSATFQGCQLICDFSTGAHRPLLQPPYPYAAFTAIHTLAHPGIKATKRLMLARWVWRGMSTDITHWSRDCHFCQWAKVTYQPRAAIQQMPIPARRFSHIHLDLVGPLPRSKEGFNHLLEVEDCSSHWLEAFPLESTSTEYMADTFIGGWVARFGIPDHITLDCSPQFCSALWAHLSQRLGTLHHLTTTYHPQANGMVERSHRQLKDTLRAALLAPTGLLTS